MLSFVTKYLTLILFAALAVQVVAFNSTDSIESSRVATSTMISPITSTIMNKLRSSRETVAVPAEESSAIGTPKQFNITVSCDGVVLEGSRNRLARSLKGKGGKPHSHDGDDGEEDSSPCQEPSDQLSTAVIAGITIGCILGAAALAAVVALVVIIRRRNRSSANVDVEMTRADAPVMTQGLEGTGRNIE